MSFLVKKLDKENNLSKTKVLEKGNAQKHQQILRVCLISKRMGESDGKRKSIKFCGLDLQE